MKSLAMVMRKKQMRKLALLLSFLVCPVASRAATTVILTTTTTNGLSDLNATIANALPSYGPYIFSVSIAPFSSGTPISGVQVYLQQKGLSGTNYTIVNSTFTSCSGTCTQTIATDVFNGGTIVPRWAITSGSATITVTAINVTP